MLGYLEYITKYPPPDFMFKKNLISFDRLNGALIYRLNYPITEVKGFGKALHADQLSQIVQRPRILKFNNMDFEALENIEIRIPADCYEQPFETVIVDLPDHYRKIRMDREVVPLFVASTWRKHLHMLSLHIFLSDGCVYGCVIGNTTHDLEEQLIGTGTTFVDSLPVTKEEQEIYKKILKACLNASLFATQCELLKSVPNEKYYRKLELRQGDPHTDSWRRFKSYPFVYMTNASVAKATHLRRAHWRMQRHGVGLSLTKRILIAATWVNK